MCNFVCEPTKAANQHDLLKQASHTAGKTSSFILRMSCWVSQLGFREKLFSHFQCLTRNFPEKEDISKWSRKQKEAKNHIITSFGARVSN